MNRKLYAFVITTCVHFSLLPANVVVVAVLTWKQQNYVQRREGSFLKRKMQQKNVKKMS